MRCRPPNENELSKKAKRVVNIAINGVVTMVKPAMSSEGMKPPSQPKQFTFDYAYGMKDTQN